MEAHRPVMMPEDEVTFRLAQLLLLLEAVAGQDAKGANLERIGYYDFLSANPFLVVASDGREGSLLRLAGFDPQVLSYASSSQRFTSRRERIQHDLGRVCQTSGVTGVVGVTDGLRRGGRRR